MSKVSIQGDASGTGTLTIAAPNTNSNYTLTLPTNTGTVMTSASDTFSGGLTLGGDLTLDSNGIYLGGTGAANYLDDYEEGTWTCDIDISGSTGSGTSGDTSSLYVKVGRLVTVTVQRRVNGFTSPTGTFTISGSLPFAASRQGVFKFVNRALTGSGFGRWSGSNIYVNSSDGSFDYNDTTSGITVTDSRTIKWITFTFSYYTAA